MGGLNDPRGAGIAWARFRQLMRWMVLATIGTIVIALLYLRQGGGVVTIHMVLATIAGVGGSVLLASALMLLVFMSSGTGHDDEVGRP